MAKSKNTSDNHNNDGVDTSLNSPLLIVNVYNKLVEFQNKWNEFEQNRIKHGEPALGATIKGSGLAAFYITVGEAIDKHNPASEAFDMLDFCSNLGLDIDAGAISTIKKGIDDFKQENTELIGELITPDVIEMTGPKGIFMNTENKQIYMPKQGLQLSFDYSENLKEGNQVTIKSIKVINPKGSMSIKEIAYGLDESLFHDYNVDELLFNFNYKNINNPNEIVIDYNLSIEVPENYTTYTDENGIKIETGLISTGKMKVLITDPNTNTVTEYLQDVFVDNEVIKNTYLADGTLQTETLSSLEPSIIYDSKEAPENAYELKIIQTGENLTLEKISTIDASNIVTGDINIIESVPLTKGQTISHIAQKTDFNSIDLLEYNNLTLEEAKSLPVGYKVLVPKEKPINIEGEYGTIKLFGNHDDTFTARFPDEQNNKTNITFSEDSDLLIYGDRTNPNKITFTDKETFQSWEKDDNGIMYLKELSSDDFDISFKIENGKKVLDSIEIKADNVSLEKIAKYTDYTKEELKEFNHLESDTLNKDSNLQIPVSKKEIEGGHGKINQYTTQDGEYVFIVPNGDSSTSTYATFTDGFNQKGAYEIFNRVYIEKVA